MLFRSKVVGFVWQQTARNLLPYLSAVENVEMPMILDGRRKTRERAIELLGLVGLPDRLHHRPERLSGGEQQRVAIVRALANDPKILLADEPTGNLDHTTGEHVMNALIAIVRETGLAALIATHNLDLAQQREHFERGAAV